MQEQRRSVDGNKRFVLLASPFSLRFLTAQFQDANASNDDCTLDC
jgi:hypothetical protein